MKAKPSDTRPSNQTPTPIADESESPQTEIAVRAHQLYLSEGCPEGRHLEHWLQAECEVNTDATSDTELAQ